jgi:hypothetical protein
MVCSDERWDLAPSDQRQISSLFLSGYLAQIDYSYSTFGLADLEKFDEIVPLITHWISWNPGNGISVLIGMDKILGIGDSSLLSQDLLVALKNKNICYLYQARAQSSLGFITEQWKNNFELGLSGSLATEWNSFCKVLIDSGIHLQPREDSLIWTGGDHSGFLTVKNVYNAMEKKFGHNRLQGGGDKCGLGI